MPYAITSTGWRSIQEDWPLAEGERFSEELPQWLIQLAEQQRIESAVKTVLDSLLDEASKIIQPLQDDYDVGEITEDGLSNLKAWKKYRSALSKTSERSDWPSTTDWPAPPLT
ncbi:MULTISPECIES: tail fiber assembly protein [unclassified Pseudomonas]|uniref:tail fiber assembly protein n=1 Tax=unclassified Pseudomonas TaxID=196821 RepID=UPI000A1EFDE4|nr:MULTISPECIES: tail fiber assembly protein [unclassified Pseudomonas]UDI95312.1 tail fiber assembly protein [Pseudomonas sp. IAC-BECa141]